MGRGFALVRTMNAAARTSGAATSIEQFENEATHSQYRVAYDVAARYVRPGDSVLDWGCGNGHFSLLLAHLGARVTGYSFEPSPACMRSSPSFTHVRGSEQEPGRIPFANDTFDCVCSVGVLEHVRETGGHETTSLAEIARILTNGGRFITFHLPNRSGWIEPTFRALGLNKHFHDRKYDAAEIRALWGAAGFDVVEIGRYNVLPRNQLRILPRFVRHGAWFAPVYDLIDDALAVPFGAIATNFYVVGRKRLAERAHA